MNGKYYLKEDLNNTIKNPETVKHAMNWLRTKKLWLGLAKAEVSLLSISV